MLNAILYEVLLVKIPMYTSLPHQKFNRIRFCTTKQLPYSA